MFNPACLIPSVKVFPLYLLYITCVEKLPIYIYELICVQQGPFYHVMLWKTCTTLSYPSHRAEFLLVRTTICLLSFSRRSIKKQDGSYEPKHHVVACSALGTKINPCRYLMTKLSSKFQLWAARKTNLILTTESR